MKTIVNVLNNPKVLAAILSVLYIVTVALAFAIASASGANAGENGYRPLQAIDETLGGTHVSAAFLALATEQAAPTVIAGN